MDSALIFYRLIVRPLWRDFERTSLMIFAVALGVSVVLAIELAGTAATGSFRSSIATLAGDNDLEIVAVSGVPEQVVGTLARLPYPLRIHARIEDHATLVDTGETIPLIGLDLLAEGSDDLRGKNSAKDFLKFLGDDDSVFVGSRLGRKPGDKIRLRINDHTRTYTVRGVFADSRAAGESAILMDVATAQRELNKFGVVNGVLLKVPGQPSLQEWEQRLRSVLPEGVEVRRQGSGTEENRRMLAAFRWNLRILSYVALVVASFLIYNTISVSVVRRRPEIGIMRALGTTRGAVLASFVGEALCLGLAGSLLGLPLGRVLASGAVQLIGSTVQSLYVSSQPGPIDLTSDSVLLALFVGTGVAVASALAPAREASLVSPVEAMARGQREFTARVHKQRDLWIALALAVAGTAASRAPAISGKPFFGYAACIFLIGASAFAIPALVDVLASASSHILHRTFGVEALLASRSLAGSLRRTSVLVGALATAIAMMTSVAIMVGSFRQTVLIWMNDQLPADLYLRPAGAPTPDQHPTMSAEFAGRLEQLPGVAAVDRLREYEISYGGLPATLASADLRLLGRYRNSDFVSGRSPEKVLSELRGTNSAIVSEPFANKHRLRAGDVISIPLGQRKASFRIADIYYDYTSERGYVVVDRNTMLQYLPDPAPSNLAVYLAPGATLESVRKEINEASAGGNILVLSNRDLRTQAIRIFDRTFAITYALEAVAVIVAVMGVFGALLALVIDRRRELGLLRFLGAATGQVRKLILMEAALLGLLANVAGLALGVVLSLVLIYVINKQSFGWTIQFHWPVAVLVGALSIVYAATLAAGLYPARIATRLNPIEVIHEE